MQNRKGLTLIELLIVVIILGALAAIAIPRISTSSRTAKQNACNTNVDTLNTAIEMYKIDNGSYPSALTDVTGDPNYFSSNIFMPYYLTRTVLLLPDEKLGWLRNS